MSDSIDQMVQAERSVTIGATKVVVREVTMKNLRLFAAACAPFLKEFDEAGALSMRHDAEGNVLPPEDFALFKVLSEHSEAMMTAAALVSNCDRAFFERLRPDQFFEVAALVVQVNGDFFVRSLAPALIKFAAMLGLVGATLSNISSLQGTGTSTSSTTPTGSTGNS